MAELFDAIARFNTILIDFCRDVWGYISDRLFQTQTDRRRSRLIDDASQGQPDRFRKRRGQSGRRQRAVRSPGDEAADLALAARPDRLDGVAQHGCRFRLHHHRHPFRAARGIGKLEVNAVRLAEDLDANWEVLAEPIQTVLRRHAVPQAYEKLKELTRGTRIDAAALAAFVDELDLPEPDRERLRALIPAAYIGDAAELARAISKY